MVAAVNLVSEHPPKTDLCLDTNGAFSDARQESILFFERSTRRSNLMQDVEVDASQIAAILPVRTNFSLRRTLSAETDVTPEICGRKNCGEERRLLVPTRERGGSRSFLKDRTTPS